MNYVTLESDGESIEKLFPNNFFKKICFKEERENNLTATACRRSWLCCKAEDFLLTKRCDSSSKF